MTDFKLTTEKDVEKPEAPKKDTTNTISTLIVTVVSSLALILPVIGNLNTDSVSIRENYDKLRELSKQHTVSIDLIDKRLVLIETRSGINVYLIQHMEERVKKLEAGK